MEKIYNYEEVPYSAAYQKADFVHPLIRWINTINTQLGEKVFQGLVRVEGENVKLVELDDEVYWEVGGPMSWSWKDDQGEVPGFQSGIEALDGLKRYIDHLSQENDDAKLLIKTWTEHFGSW